MATKRVAVLDEQGFTLHVFPVEFSGDAGPPAEAELVAEALRRAAEQHLVPGHQLKLLSGRIVG